MIILKNNSFYIFKICINKQIESILGASHFQQKQVESISQRLNLSEN